MHLQNGEGTAQEISLLIQYSSQREEMLMPMEERWVALRPHGSWGLLLACLPKGWREGEAQFTAVDLIGLSCWIDDTDMTPATQSPSTLSLPTILWPCILFLHGKYEPNKYMYVLLCYTHEYPLRRERVTKMKWSTLNSPSKRVQVSRGLLHKWGLKLSMRWTGGLMQCQH